MASKAESTKTEIKKEVKIVKKQVKKEQNGDDQNGDRNGDADIEAELTVKLPTKKTGAKTETKVEVVEKILPDGSIKEVKTTTTKTTIDGKTEITTRTETKITPKEEDEEEEVEEEEVEENGEVVVEEVQDEKEQEEEIEEPKSKTVKESSSIKENGNNIVKTEERSETTTTKKVVVLQNTAQEDAEEEVEEEEEIAEEAEPVTVVIKKPVETISVQEDTNEEEEEEIDEAEEVKDEIQVEEKENKQEKVENVQTTNDEAEEVEEEEEEEEAEENEKNVVKKDEDDNEEKVEPVQKEDEEEVEVEEEDVNEEEDEEKNINEIEKPSESSVKPNEEDEEEKEEEPEKEEAPIEKAVAEDSTKVETVVQVVVEKEKKEETVEVQPSIEVPTAASQLKQNIPLREPSIPLEKVEDVEIKPIGLPSETISKSHTENTEIITSTSPFGPLSTQTEYNKVENIVTVNRTTKILDHSYENLTQQGIPTVKTYFAPSSRDRVLASPLPSRPYQPVYPPEPQPERRHSLLLERLSMERQMPTDIYQNNYQYTNQGYDEQGQYLQEPQSEVLTVSNVKPSTIKNQDWFQQSRRENIIYNNIAPTTPAPPPPSTPLWSQPQTRPQPQVQTQPPVQPYVQPQPQYQPSYTENISQDRSNTYQQNTYTTYTPQPTWGSNTINVDPPLASINTPSPHPYISKDTTDNYQPTSQQYSSSYVPPPWEQDSSYVDNSNQNYYQPPPTTYTPTQNQSWKPAPIPNKFSKATPTAYIPPAPNQSFVKPVSNIEPPRLPGRKTYYSEYERRYISVPEATYIPGETKFQAQPDPSPQYYYDNNEPNEVIEHEWRKELREFAEKSTKTEQTEINVKPPWEAEAKYSKTLPTTYTPTPTWTQTVRPRSWRERSYDAEYIGSQEWPKTNTLGRGRPLSSTYGKSSIDAPIPERTRGVSVDRYNPNNYQSPISAEHPPVQTHTLTTPAPHATYHNPNVPSYHARASAEPRGQPVYPQSRTYREPQPSPFQSRSFKYLQWITGTED